MAHRSTQALGGARAGKTSAHLFLVDDSTPFRMEPWPASGFSNSLLFQLQNESGTFAVRSWPDNDETLAKCGFWSAITSENRLGDPFPFPKVHAWLSPVAGQPFVYRFAGRLWTVCDWIVGQPIQRADIDLSLVKDMARVLGKIHRHVAEASNRDSFNGRVLLPITRMASPTIAERWLILKQLHHSVIEAARNLSFLKLRGLNSAVVHSLEQLLEQKEILLEQLDEARNRIRTCHWIVRDVWYENLLVDASKRFASIVDLGAARLDWPGLDLVRLLGSMIPLLSNKTSHLGGQPRHESVLEKSLASRRPMTIDHWSDRLWSEVYEGYKQEHPEHGLESLEECRMLETVSGHLSVAMWVEWLHRGTFDLNDRIVSNRIAERIVDLTFVN
jgi:hypothetical protein